MDDLEATDIQRRRYDQLKELAEKWYKGEMVSDPDDVKGFEGVTEDFDEGSVGC